MKTQFEIGKHSISFHKPTKVFFIGKTVSGFWYRILTPVFMLDIGIKTERVENPEQKVLESMERRNK